MGEESQTGGRWRTRLLRDHWKNQLAALIRLEGWLLRESWLEAPWWRRVGSLLGLLLLLWPSASVLSAVLLLAPALIAEYLPAAITMTGCLLVIFQVLRAPGVLWEGDVLIWCLLAPVPRSLLLLRSIYRLLRDMVAAMIVLLLLPSLAVWLTHGSGVLIGQLWLTGAYLLLLCSFLAPTGLLLLAWCLGVRRARSAVASAALLLCLPALLVIGLWLAATAQGGKGWLGAWSDMVQVPAALLLRAEGDLLTLPAGRLTGADGLVLLGGLLLLLALGTGYLWLGSWLYQDIWEGLQTQRERRSRQSGAAVERHLLWELAWRLPGLPPSWAALLGYCWREGMWSWTDLPTIVVDVTISVGIMASTLFSPGGLQLYRDFWPVLGVLNLLMGSLPMLLVLSRGLIKRLLLPRWLWRSLSIKAGSLFGALWLAILLPSLVLWLGLSLIGGWLLGASPLAIVICLLMLGLGLAAAAALSLMDGIVEMADGERSAFPVLLPTAILGVLLLLSVTLITALLFIPTLPAQLQRDVGLSSLSSQVCILTGTLATCLIAGITALACWLGRRRLARLLGQEGRNAGRYSE
ncbi:hypothetical protein [Thermogemmatispora tikiterensis]|uniref:Uncharacterized protein n=1 Tax=Thermogemmatispora tikiterensis TaxID=1825093 RepID=A0A328VV50_9CHLR|nr:hypothetical protein [Thermogemmatispora tikiterensis]RAQ97965.1 hypothetical protein A4R35_20670 [Thermogemmatispora tikiterensis]